MTTDKKTAEEINQVIDAIHRTIQIFDAKRLTGKTYEMLLEALENAKNISSKICQLPIQEGEVDKYPNGRCQKEEEGQDRCEKRCDHCIKYYYPLDSQDESQVKQNIKEQTTSEFSSLPHGVKIIDCPECGAEIQFGLPDELKERFKKVFGNKNSSQAKQGGFNEEHLLMAIEMGRTYEEGRLCYEKEEIVRKIKSLPQAHPDHIPDTGKLVKTMSVECYHPFTKTEDGKTFCADCNEPIQLSQMSVEEAKDFACKFSNWIYRRGYVKYAGGDMWYHENHAGGDKTIEELCKDFIKDFPIQRYIQSQQSK